MVSLMRHAITENQKFIFDPGQMAPYFTTEELNELIPSAFLLIGNEYEINLLSKTMGISKEELYKISKE